MSHVGRDYPEWLWKLLDKRPPLSELRRKRVEDMSMDEVSVILIIAWHIKDVYLEGIVHCEDVSCWELLLSLPTASTSLVLSRGLELEMFLTY